MDNTYRHRYLYAFKDGNTAELIMEVIDERIVVTAKWDKPADWLTIKDEYLDWSFQSSDNYYEILEGIFGPFYLDGNKIIKV